MKCILRPAEDRSLCPVELENGQAKFIGRTQETKITEKRCSKQQVEVTANVLSRTVNIKQLGPNHSCLNGKIIGCGLETVAKNGDVCELLQGQLKYKIFFEEGKTDAASPPRKIPKMFLPPTKSSPANEFKKDKSFLQGEWQDIGNNELVIYSVGENIKEPKPNVGSFDMDGTLIGTKSGKVFPKDSHDWKFLFPHVPEYLQTYFTQHPDFKFVIFTNQGGCKDKSQLNEMKKKIEKITSGIGLPVVVVIAPKKNIYRKPLTGGWDYFVKEYNGGVAPDLETSFYCGDAAGRVGKKNKDHAHSDRLFALNIGIPFKLPEEFFMNSIQSQREEIGTLSFDPKRYLASSLTNDHVKFKTGSQEMIIMVGYPASGKSGYVKNVILPKGYVHINRDTLKTQSKCLSATNEALRNGQSVVVDNTNPEKRDRAEYIKAAKAFNVPVRCFKMNVEHSHALHNNKFRELTNAAHISVPAVAYNAFKSRYQEPAKEEGYSEIVYVNFVPNFENFDESEREFRRKLYSSYLLEK